MIPDLIRKMVDAPDEVVLWGDGSPTREFLYVDDCVEGLVLAAERYDGAEPVNLGTGAEISIRELAELVADVTGFEGGIGWDTSMPNGQPRRQLDATRARELFGFEAQTALREGLERTVAWYRAARARVMLAEFVLRQSPPSAAVAAGAARHVLLRQNTRRHGTSGRHGCARRDPVARVSCRLTGRARRLALLPGARASRLDRRSSTGPAPHADRLRLP